MAGLACCVDAGVGTRFIGRIGIHLVRLLVAPGNFCVARLDFGNDFAAAVDCCDGYMVRRDHPQLLEITWHASY